MLLLAAQGFSLALLSNVISRAEQPIPGAAGGMMLVNRAARSILCIVNCHYAKNLLAILIHKCIQQIKQQ